MLTDDQIGARVVAAREHARWSQPQLAEEMRVRFGWIASTVSRVENGFRHLRYREAVALNEMFGYDLFADEEQTPDANALAAFTLRSIRSLLEGES